MSECERIHETVVRDVIDIIDTIKNTDEFDFQKNKKLNFSSIAKASQNLTLVFPVIISKTLNIQTASMVAKAIERKCVTMLQISLQLLIIS